MTADLHEYVYEAKLAVTLRVTAPTRRTAQAVAESALGQVVLPPNVRQSINENLRLRGLVLEEVVLTIDDGAGLALMEVDGEWVDDEDEVACA